MSEKKDLKEKDLDSVDGGSQFGFYICHNTCKGKTKFNFDKTREVDGKKEFYCSKCNNWFPVSEFSIA